MRKIKWILAFVVVGLTISSPCYAQEWAMTYGGPYGQYSHDDAFSVQETQDGGYIVAGDTYIPYTNRWDLWILKLNPDGTVAWQKTYGGGDYEQPDSIQQTQDGGYIVAGYTFSFGASSVDMWVLKLDASGEIPGCGAMGTSNATVTSTSVVGQDTTVTPQDTSVIPTDTSVIPQDTSAEISVICPREDIAVVRHKTNGKQRLFIFNAPLGLKDDIEPPIATDLTFGSSANDHKNIAMAGVDYDGDGIDEIAVIREKLNGKQRLFIFNPPTVAGGETGAPIASDLTFGNANTDNNNIAITGIHLH